MSFPFILSGTVTYDSAVLASVKVTARNERTNYTISANTDSNGKYVLDAANFTNGYATGDIVTIFVLYSNAEDYEETTITSAGGGVTVNLTLVEVPASDELRYMKVQEFYDFHHLTVGGTGVPLTNEVVKTGVMIEEEIDRRCQTRFSDGQIEVEINDCDSTTGWTGSTDATAIATETTDGNYKTKTGALKLGKSGVTQAFLFYNVSATARVFTDKIVGCYVYFASLSGLATSGTAVRIKYGSDSSNYYHKDWFKIDLQAGWNFLYFKKGDEEVGTTGTPVDSQCTFFEIYFTTTAVTDVFTSGDIRIDNVLLVHKDHFQDEYLNTPNLFTYDYYLTKAPLNRMLLFLANTANEEDAETWVELDEYNDEIDLQKEIGVVRIRDIDITDEENIHPQTGTNQIRAVYIYGRTFVPRDIKKLVILMVSRDLMMSAVAKSLMQGQDSFTSSHFTALDSQIDSILARYQNYDILNT